MTVNALGLSSLNVWSGARGQALARLDTFAPYAGRAYAAERNHDFGGARPAAVSLLSPWVRHRVISEEDVVRRVLRDHSLGAAEKFIQEVCWRTYWKGWLEQRPQVWAAYLDDVARETARVEGLPVLRSQLADALAGRTGIACFDAWVHELLETGYLHNHARMWFASIWIFTLKLPWALGADFFLRHLLDGDAASNTLSWRWVGGLQTVGKTYLARADNIATYTGGRFRPEPGELADEAKPLVDLRPAAPRVPLREASAPRAGEPAVLLITEDDVSVHQWPLGDLSVVGIAVAPPPLSIAFAPNVLSFKNDVFSDALHDAEMLYNVRGGKVSDAASLIAFAQACGASQIVTHLRPVGFSRSETDLWIAPCCEAGLSFHEVQRAWDQAFWPHAKAGFFQLKDKIPSTLRDLGLL